MQYAGWAKVSNISCQNYDQSLRISKRGKTPGNNGIPQNSISNARQCSGNCKNNQEVKTWWLFEITTR